MGTSRRKEQRHPAWRRKKKKDEESSFRPLPRDRRRYCQSVSLQLCVCLCLQASISPYTTHALGDPDEIGLSLSAALARHVWPSPGLSMHAHERKTTERAKSSTQTDMDRRKDANLPLGKCRRRRRRSRRTRTAKCGWVSTRRTRTRGIYSCEKPGKLLRALETIFVRDDWVRLEISERAFFRLLSFFTETDADRHTHTWKKQPKVRKERR